MATVSAETRGAVGLARLDRPESRNALSAELMEELASLLERWEDDPEVRCIVIAGSDRWFAAGADIKAMARRTFAETLTAPPKRPCCAGAGGRQVSAKAQPWGVGTNNCTRPASGALASAPGRPTSKVPSLAKAGTGASRQSNGSFCAQDHVFELHLNSSTVDDWPTARASPPGSRRWWRRSSMPIGRR